MKKKIILVVCLLFCFVFKPVHAMGEVVAINRDNIIGEVGTACTKTIEVVIGQKLSDTTWKFQDSVTFKPTLTIEDVETFFTVKPLPSGLQITNIEFYEDDGDKDYSILDISIAGTIDSDFDNNGYIDVDNPSDPPTNLIQMSIDPKYLNGYVVVDSEHPQPLTLDVKLSTGKYQIAKYFYTVTFDAQGIGIAPENEEVQKGFNATKPDDLTCDGYTFEGWYIEPECSNLFDFENTIILEDITLYAKWVEIVEEPIVEEPTFVPSFVIPKTGID